MEKQKIIGEREKEKELELRGKGADRANLGYSTNNQTHCPNLRHVSTYLSMFFFSSEKKASVVFKERSKLQNSPCTIWRRLQIFLFIFLSILS